MVRDFDVAKEKEPEAWMTAIDPEETEQIQTTIGESIEMALQEGPEYKDVKERKKNEKSKVNVFDRSAQDPKEFLEHQYHGRCQICSTRLKLANGKSYFEVYRIREDKGEAWWSNNPYNILSLCPNCHALAKHGGSSNFISIIEEAELVSLKETFPQEVEEFHGDFHQIEIVHNGVAKHMVLSPIHIAYFTALLEKVTKKEVLTR